ncbi:MAG TPA: lamin tail domain-containing protein [Myxococcota bacterium]|jgi:hypothetical protein|nr:lamin tail domain-containing protein [Myxococcota bacterium]
MKSFGGAGTALVMAIGLVALGAAAAAAAGCDCQRHVVRDSGGGGSTDGGGPSPDSSDGIDGGGTGVEICDNGISDDGDPYIDCDDFDCEFDPACVVSATVTIRDVQDPALRAAAMLVPDSSIVTINDVIVTAVETTPAGARKSFFIQEQTGAPEYSGVFVFVPTSAVGMWNVEIGDVINITAEFTEFDGGVGPETVTELDFVSDVTIVSSGNALPAPVMVDPADVATGGALSEQFEGVLVQVIDVSVVALDAMFGVFILNDPMFGLQVDDFLFAYTLPTVGTTFSSITGVMTFNAFAQLAQLLPRDLADMVIVSSVAALEPTPSVVAPGAAVTLNARLNAPAGVGGQLVCVSSSDAGVTVPAMVTVTAGALSAPVAVSVGAGTAAGTLATISAATAAACPTAAVDATAAVYVDAAPPVLTGLAPDPATVQVGLTSPLTVTLSAAPPAGSGGVGVLVSSADPGTVAAPAMVVVPEAATMAMFDVTGVTIGGPVTVTATLGADVFTSDVTVTDIMGTPVTTLALSEVLYDVAGTDTGMEFVELYNGSSVDRDLSNIVIENGGTSYVTIHTFPAGTMILAGECMLVGPGAGTFTTDIQNSCSTTAGACDADGVALTDMTNPMLPDILDAVIYGTPLSNNNMLFDETDTPGAVDVGDAPADSSIERIGPTTWRIRPSAPTPGDCSLIM